MSRFICVFQNYCYQYSCLSDRKDKCQSPLEHDKAVKEGRAELCPMTNKGCYVSLYIIKAKLIVYEYVVRHDNQSFNLFNLYYKDFVFTMTNPTLILLCMLCI